MEALHCRAARIIFELPWEMSNVDVMKKANWSSLAFMYKISLAKLMYKIYNNLTPDAMSAIIKNNDNIKRYQLRKKLKHVLDEYYITLVAHLLNTRIYSFITM